MAGYVGYKRTIQLDFNYDAVKQGVPKVNQQMALLNSEFNKASAQVKATGNAMDKLTLNNQKLANSVQIQKDKVSGLEKELEKLTSAETKNQRAITSKTIEINNAKAKLTELQTAYANSNKEVEKSSTLFGKARLELENFKLGAERAGIDLNKLKSDFIATTAALTAFGTITGKAFMSFEDSMIKSRTIMDENVMSYAQMQENVKNMANQYAIDANIMAEANYNILSANVSTADSLLVLKQSSILAKTGFTDVATAADILTSIMNGYGVSVNDASVLVDQLIKTQKVGKLTIGELSSSMGDLIGIASSVNVPIVEVEASIAAMTQSGIKADTAITNMKQILSTIANPSAQASEAADKYRVSMDASSIASKGFAKWLEEVLRKTHGSSEALGEMFGNVKSWSGMVTLAKEDANAFSRCLEEITGSAGTADTALGMIEDTTSEKFKKAINDMKTSIINLGEALSPIIEVVAKIVDIVASIPTPVTLAVVAFASMTKVLTMVSSAMVALGAGGGIAASGLSAIGLAGGISLPIIIAIAGAIALVVAMIALLNNSKADSSISSTTNSCTQAMQKATSAVNSTKSKKGYASGTNYVKEDGYYTINEGDETETFLRRGTQVRNASRTAREEKGADMSKTNKLLESLILEVSNMKSTINNLPSEQLRLARM